MQRDMRLDEAKCDGAGSGLLLFAAAVVQVGLQQRKSVPGLLVPCSQAAKQRSLRIGWLALALSLNRSKVHRLAGHRELQWNGSAAARREGWAVCEQR